MFIFLLSQKYSEIHFLTVLFPIYFLVLFIIRLYFLALKIKITISHCLCLVVLLEIRNEQMIRKADHCVRCY